MRKPRTGRAVSATRAARGVSPVAMFLLLLALLATRAPASYIRRLGNSAAVSAAKLNNQLHLRSTAGGGTSDRPTTLGQNDTPCDTVFTCPECLGTKNCGWCETDGENPLCVAESNRNTNCDSSKDNWIGQSPPGQQCPNALFLGTTLDPKSENNADDIGGGGFAASGRKSSSPQEIAEFKEEKRKKERIEKLKKLPANIGNCLEKAQLEFGDKVVGTRPNLVVGFWFKVPYGCSVQSSGDWAAHYNFDSTGKNDGDMYTVVK